MFLTDYIRVYENTIPESLCNSLIAKFDADPNKQEGRIDTENGPHNKEARSCLEINVTRSQEWAELQAPLIEVARFAAIKYSRDCSGIIFPGSYGCEEFRLKKYDPERKDHFAMHTDVGTYASARRFLVMMWYLNDVAEGGETFFPHMNLYIKPQRGRLLMFPPFWMYPHEAKVPISNAKYVIGTYLHLSNSNTSSVD